MHTTDAEMRQSAIHPLGPAIATGSSGRKPERREPPRRARTPRWRRSEGWVDPATRLLGDTRGKPVPGAAP